jgi:hypothetical protein
MNTMTSPHRYVVGHLTPPSGDTHPPPTLVVATRTQRGWRTRSTDRGYNHDYVSHEEFADVMEWMDVDLHRATLLSDRDMVLDACVTHSGSAPPTGFLLPGGCASVHEEVDAVLRHLEYGP